MNTAEAIKAAMNELSTIAYLAGDIDDDSLHNEIKDKVRIAVDALSASAEQQPVGFLRKTEHGLVFMPLTEQPLEDGTRFYTAPQASQPIKCKTCNGNDVDIPCAYPSKGVQGCLRDKRLHVSQPVALTDAEILKVFYKEHGEGFALYEVTPGNIVALVRSLLSATSQPSEAGIHRKALEEGEQK